MAPPLGAQDDPVRLDIELLSPDRLVRYLARHVSRSFLERLADSWLEAAADPLPESSVTSVDDPDTGLAVFIIGSTEMTVTIEVLVVSALDDDVSERDGISFEVPRATHHGRTN